jgi:glycerophosphoryl diester phosphodiesterase
MNMSAPSSSGAAAPAHAPLVIGHRGAPGYLPEHTLEGYRRAVALGADFIEPDLVMTKDQVMIARHEIEISLTTDVAIKFPSRKRTKIIDGVSETGWFADDFTLAEIKTLRARERLAFRDHRFDGKYEIPTLEEILKLAVQLSNESGRLIGVYPEIKHSTYHVSVHLPMEVALVALLRRYGYNSKNSPAIIQSAEISNLRRLRLMTPLRLLQLIGGPGEAPFDQDAQAASDADEKFSGPRTSADKKLFYQDLLTPENLKKIALYADGIGPDKTWIIPVEKSGHLGPPTRLVENAHAAGLFVHPYTFRSETQFLNPDYNGDPQAEYVRFFKLGVDGLFSDFADVAASARNK